VDEGRLKKDNSEILLYQQVVRKRQKFRRWVERGRRKSIFILILVNY